MRKIMFDNFPKTRQELPLEYIKIYENHIRENRDGKTAVTSLSQRMEGWLHKKVAIGSGENKSTLEIGAGTLNQLQYESVGAEYDVIEPFKALYEDSTEKNKVRKFFDLIEEVPLKSRYNRIISCATFEHIENLPYVVSKSGLLLCEKGQLRVAVPTEGGFLWKLSYTMTTGVEFWIKHKLNYSVIMKYDHINTIDEIQSVIKWFFRDVSTQRMGFGKHLSFYTFFCAETPDINRCNEYITSQCKDNNG